VNQQVPQRKYARSMHHKITKRKTMEAKDVSPNINRTQAAEGPKNAVFCPW